MIVNAISSFLISPWFNGISFLITILSVILAYIFYKKSSKNIVPKYTLTSKKMIANNISEYGPLTVYYDGHEIPNFTASEFVFWNDGNATLLHDDIASADPLRFTAAAPYEILSARIIKASSPANKFSVLCSPDSANVEVEFDYLDKGQGGVIQILHTGEKSGDLAFSGSIKGFGRPQNTGKTKAFPLWFIIVEIALLIILSSIIITDINNMKKFSDKVMARISVVIEEGLAREALLKEALDSLERNGQVDMEIQQRYFNTIREQKRQHPSVVGKQSLVSDANILMEEVESSAFIVPIICSLMVGLLFWQMFYARIGYRKYGYPKDLVT